MYCDFYGLLSRRKRSWEGREDGERGTAGTTAQRRKADRRRQGDLVTQAREEGKTLEPREQENNEAPKSQASVMSWWRDMPRPQPASVFQVEGGHAGWGRRSVPSPPDRSTSAASSGSQAKLAQLYGSPGPRKAPPPPRPGYDFRPPGRPGYSHRATPVAAHRRTGGLVEACW